MTDLSSPSVTAVAVTYDLDTADVARVIRTAAWSLPFGSFITVDNGPPGSLPCDLSDLNAPDASMGVNAVPYHSNRGFGAGCNAGVANAPASPLILLVNPDAEISADMVGELLANLAREPRLGIASPQLCDVNGAPVETGDSFPTVLGLALGKIRLPTSTRQRQALPYNQSTRHGFRAVDWVSGAVMMIRREAWDAVGGFDPAYFLYYEDIDLCRRVRAAGWEVGIVPDATAIHESGGSQWRPGTRTRVERIYFESQAYYFRKHYGRVMEWLLRAVRLPYLATGLRRRFVARFGVTVGSA